MLTASGAMAQDDIFKSSEFLKWKRTSQDFYIETSVGMASLIAGRNNAEQGECLDKWYFSDVTEKNKFVLKTMKRFPDYHPRGVILAVLEKQCGKLTY